MANDDTLNELFPAKDIIFKCGVCGKSLVINALGAGLAITCPDCGAEQQVPLSGSPGRSAPAEPGGVEVASPVVEPSAATTDVATATADEQKVEHELPEISDVLADSREQINALTQENDELQFRRRFLEKRHAIAVQNLQALRREMIAIRAAMERTEAILQAMEDPSSGDTQPIA